MNEKTTDELALEIHAATDIADYLTKNKQELLSQNLPEHLEALLAEKKLTRADVVRGSNLDRVYLYQIFDGKKKPSRDKLIAIAFGLRLSVEEAQKLLKISCNRELYARDERDALILFALEKQDNLLNTNVLLNNHGLETLGITKKESL